MKTKILTVLLLSSFLGFSQEIHEDLPYYEIPEYSDDFTAGTVAGRMVDALGFRFYWASHDLKATDLDFKINEDGRSVSETIDHIYDLSKIIVNSTLKKANDRGAKEEMTYVEKRKAILMSLKKASDILKASDDISEFKIIFGEQQIPFWNQVNGPIADAIWHCGQMATSRRASGNPINPKVNHFTGKVRQ
ncbi:hypothetical protein Q2T40_07550 [Winogradskyella maritima]|uniref:DinB family protein n=1 Tax=Winogradskyella maritima TaxID=1517766 RepID=A0ABV8AKK5_9FLAO|nr:hypothetical protein [Winogradskyella maritima]